MATRRLYGWLSGVIRTAVFGFFMLSGLSLMVQGLWVIGLPMAALFGFFAVRTARRARIWSLPRPDGPVDIIRHD